jgi:hypothetical protein
MKSYPLAIVISVLLSSVTALAQQATQPSSQPSTQPLPTPAKVSIDLDDTTAGDAIAKLVDITGLPMKWQGRPGKRFSLHAKDRSLLDVIADICVQGSCIPRNNYGPGEMFFTATETPPLAVYRPTDTSLLILKSMQCQERIDVKNGNARSQSCNLQMIIVFDPAARVSSVRGFDVDRVLAEDGTEYPNNNNFGWNQQPLRLDAISAWEVQSQVSVQGSLGKKMSVFGFIRAYALQDFAQVVIDDLTAADKSFGTDELKCTVGKSSNDSSISLVLKGPLIEKYGPQRLPQMLSGGMVTSLDQNDQPLALAVNVNMQGSSAHLNLRSNNRGPWKEGEGPASVTIRLPRAARQVEIPVELRDLVIR